MCKVRAKRDQFVGMRRVPHRKGQILVNIIVHLELALLPELHGSRGRDGFRDAADILDGAVGVHRDAALDVGPPIPF
jgi:hypothetical protein